MAPPVQEARAAAWAGRAELFAGRDRGAHATRRARARGPDDLAVDCRAMPRAGPAPSLRCGHRDCCPDPADPVSGSCMIGPGTGVRVYLACGVTDMRKGISGLAMLAQTELRQKPASGAVFAFRGRRGDRLKLLYWDGQGFCLYYKILERGRFPWPSAADGTARLTSAQLAMLWEGIDWRRPNWGAPPTHAG
jgi:transposase